MDPVGLPPEFPPLSDPHDYSRRDAELLAYVVDRGLAPHLLEWVAVATAVGTPGTAGYHEGVLRVSPDFIGVGSLAHLYRLPLPCRALQSVANHYGALLTTAHIEALVHAQAQVRTPFRPWRAEAVRMGVSMNALKIWTLANDSIEAHRGGRAGLVSDGKKAVVVGPVQARYPHHCAIYGAWDAAGGIIQGLNAEDHGDFYSDYSQGGRLVHSAMVVDGVERAVREVAGDPALCALVTGHEGPDPGLTY